MKMIVAAYGLEIILIIGGSALMWLGIKLKTSALKHICFNVSTICLVLGVLEFTLTLKARPDSDLSFTPQYYEHHSQLGYRAKEGDFSVEARKRWIESGDNIYSVRYGFRNGRRSTHNSNLQSSNYTLFLGGSFVFGEGVNDDQTLPYFYNQHLTEKRNIRNYGLSGYGTHQVYTIAKHQIAQDLALTDAQDVDVFYWFIIPHIWRTNGLSIWDRDGPHYQLNNNQVEHLGSFRQTQRRLPLILRGWHFIWRHSAFSKSYIWGIFSIRDRKTDLTIALIKQTHEILEDRGFKFTVLLQSAYKPAARFNSQQQAAIEKIKNGLKASGIPFVDVNDVFMQSNLDINMLKIKGDGHPRADFHRYLGAHLAELERD